MNLRGRLARLERRAGTGQAFDQLAFNKAMQSFEDGAESAYVDGELWTRRQYEEFQAEVKRGLVEWELEITARHIAEEGRRLAGFRGAGPDYAASVAYHEDALARLRARQAALRAKTDGV